MPPGTWRLTTERQVMITKSESASDMVLTAFISGSTTSIGSGPSPAKRALTPPDFIMTLRV